MDVRDYKTFTYIMYKTKIDEDNRKKEQEKAEADKRADEDRKIKEELNSIKNLPPQIRDLKRMEILKKYNKDVQQQNNMPRTSITSGDINSLQEMLEDEGIEI